MTTVGGMSTLESLGQQPLDIGAQLGGRSATAGGNVGQFLYGGGMGAARTMESANMLNPTASFLQGLGSNDRFMSGLGNLFSRGFNFNTPSFAAGNVGTSNMSSSYYTPNPNASYLGNTYY